MLIRCLSLWPLCACNDGGKIKNGREETWVHILDWAWTSSSPDRTVILCSCQTSEQYFLSAFLSSLAQSCLSLRKTRWKGWKWAQQGIVGSSWDGSCAGCYALPDQPALALSQIFWNWNDPLFLLRFTFCSRADKSARNGPTHGQKSCNRRISFQQKRNF